MDNTQEQNPYEECLKELFNNFDSSGSGSLNPGEVSELCLSLHLDDATPALLNAVLQNQDPLTARVDFDQFKNTLILVLSSCPEPRQAEHETLHHPEYPEIQPKLVKGSKRYGRRSMPEFIDPTSDLSDVMHANLSKCQDLEDNHDLAVPRKRERWNAHDSSTEEYEAEGQMNLWKPDIPSTPRGSIAPVSNQLEEKLHEACDVLAISLDGFACPTELLALCEYLGMEINGDVFQSLNGDGVMNVQEFISKVANQNKPPTPSCSTPYWQLKRHLSIQPFREGGHRITPPSALTSTIGLRLFSALDDGSGYTPAEHILDTWMEEGIEKSTEILQALNFSPDGKLSLGDLTMALENELLVSKNGIYLAALASFKAEIRYLLERVDHEFQEKEKIRSDLEKAAKLKTQLAIEVDEHHLLIEHTNSQSLRKLEQDHKENLAALRSEVMKEMDQIQQQAVLQREELEAENEKIREDESFLRDHLSIYVKENGRLEKELFDANEKLVEAESQVTKLQMSLDNIIKEKFDDLDPGMADFFIQEECMKQLRSNYEAQCRELQDRIDELQCELQEIHSVRQTHQPCHKPLSDELENKSPGMKADPGVGSDEVPPFSMSLETEIMLEQLKEQHLREMQNLSHQLESEITEFENMVEKQRTTHEDQRVALALQHQQEVQALREEMAGIHSQTQELHTQLEQAELERTWLEQKQRLEREELENLHQEEVGALKRQLLEVHTLKAELEKQLKVLELQQAAADGGTATELQELREQHATQMKKLEENNRELFEARVEEEKKKWLEEKDKLEKRLLESSTREKELLKQSHEEDLKARLQEARHKFEEERGDIVQKLTDQWQEERAQLDEQNNKSLQVVLEEGMFRFVKEQEVKESQLKKEWESKQAQLLECQKTLLDKIFQERLQLQEQYEQREKKLKQGWEKERLQLERDFEAMCQGRLDEEKEKLETEKEKLETRLEHLMTEQKAYLEDGHREAMQELTVKHTEERNTLSSMLDILRDDIAHERGKIEISFSQRIKEVEDRFSDDQDSAAQRFQADILKVEQHYQSRLNEISGKHDKQKLDWEEQLQKALKDAEEKRKMMEDAIEQERGSRNQEWSKGRLELERIHEEELEALAIKNQQLQNDLDKFISLSQTKEVELSRQLNELHNHLQTKEVLLALSDKKAMKTELLLNQTMLNFKWETVELLKRQAELNAKNSEILSNPQMQITERIEVLTQCDDLKMKIKELEMLLKQVAEDFELDRKDLQGHISMLVKLKSNLENDQEEFISDIQGIGMQDNVVANFSNQESVEMITETGAVDEFYENIQSFDVKHCEEGTRDKEENMSKVETVATEKLMDDFAGIKIKKSIDSWPKSTDVIGEGYKDQVSVPEDNEVGDSRPEVLHCDSMEVCHEEEPEMAHCVIQNPETPENHCIDSGGNKKEAVFLDRKSQVKMLLEVFEGVDANKDIALESCDEETELEDLAALDFESSSDEDEQCHEAVVDPSMLGETGNPCELSVGDVKDNCLPNGSHDPREEAEHSSDFSWENVTTERKDVYLKNVNHNFSVFKTQCGTATETNNLLKKKIYLLHQKTELLEKLLSHGIKKIRACNQFLEENYCLKVKMVLLMEHIKVLEMTDSKMTDLQISYEDCMYEKNKLKEQNGELKKRVWSLESKINIFPDIHEEHISCANETGRTQEENKLSMLFSELERWGDIFLLDTGFPQRPSDEDFLDLKVKVLAFSHLENSCMELEQENTKLRRAITELQDESHTLNETTQAHRSSAIRLAEENLILKQNITLLKKEDLKEAQEELIKTFDRLKYDELAANKAAQNFNKQISELCLQSQQLQYKKGILVDKDGQNIANLEKLKQQLAELIKENDRRDVFCAEEKNKLAACVSALEGELTKAQEDTARLEERNTQLSLQLSGLREKVVKVESVKNQVSHRVEKQNSVEKGTQGLQNQFAKAHENHTLEVALHSNGFKSQSKQLHRDETSQLNEQEDDAQPREKTQLLDTTMQSRKQHKHLSQSLLVRALEQDNASLKQEQEVQKELFKGCESVERHTEMESLRQENKMLKVQVAQLSRQLFESFDIHFAGLLPLSRQKMPRGQHYAEDPEHLQDDQERKMKNMEERMKEIELSLHNVKMLLKEKVAQLNNQLRKNGKADVLIQDLYVENAMLMKMLEKTKQRYKMVEKKKYLLEEKISSLNKIVHDLNPLSLLPLSYHCKFS